MGDAFGYDRAGRLTQSGLNQALPADGLSLAGEHFNTALDPAENWTYLDKQFGGQTAAVPVSLNSRNQYTSFGAPQTFDPQGNLTSDPNGTYTFDFKNRLIEADMGSGTKLFYVYDPENRLVKKTTQVGTDSKVEETLWEGWEPAAKYVDGVLAEEDVSLGSPDSVLAFRAHNDDGSTALFNLHSDLRGDTAGLSDQTGTLLEKYRYTPYGEFLITDGSDTPLSTSRTNRLFQGLTFDSDLGWYYARNRYYDPHEGRFRSQDPLGLGAGQNVYAFVGDDPVMGRDAMGLVTSVSSRVGACEVLPSVNAESGNRILDYTVLGALNTAVNAVYKVANVGLCALKAAGELQTRFENKFAGWTGSPEGEVHAFVGLGTLALGEGEIAAASEALEAPVALRIRAAVEESKAVRAASPFSRYASAEERVTLSLSRASRVREAVTRSAASQSSAGLAEYLNKDTALQYFYRKGASVQETREFMSGIDFTADVTREIIPPHSFFQQWGRVGGRLGRSFSRIGSRPDDLGVSGIGRELRLIETSQTIEVLRSTAAPIVDSWTASPLRIPTRGGDIQFTIMDIGGLGVVR